MIHIGIDPDVEKSGLAVIEAGQFVRVCSVPNPELFALIESYRGRTDVMFHLEDVNVDSATYYRARPGAVSKQAVQNKISQHVGMCKGAAKVIADVIDFYDGQVTMVKPLRGTLKKAKHEADLFKRLTGWEGRTNQDSRDAAMLILRFMEAAA